MRKPTLVAIALGALLTVAFQNCGKLGFSLASNDKSKSEASLSIVDPAPELSVTGDVPVAAGVVAQLAVLTKSVVAVTYDCARASDATSVAQGTLELMNGVGILSVTVNEALTCTFKGQASDQRTVETVFEVPIESAASSADQAAD